jgi:hypothetical protein
MLSSTSKLGAQTGAQMISVCLLKPIYFILLDQPAPPISSICQRSAAIEELPLSLSGALSGLSRLQYLSDSQEFGFNSFNNFRPAPTNHIYHCSSAHYLDGRGLLPPRKSFRSSDTNNGTSVVKCYLFRFMYASLEPVYYACHHSHGLFTIRRCRISPPYPHCIYHANTAGTDKAHWHTISLLNYQAMVNPLKSLIMIEARSEGSWSYTMVAGLLENE